MSSNAPSMPLFGDAYLADTRHLSLEEHGAYLQLMMIAWRSSDCALPDDDTRLARMLGITAGRWAKLKGTVMAFWTLTDKGWTHSGRANQERTRAHIPNAMKRAVIERDGYQCVYCRDIEGPFQFDHKQPWSRGGRDSLENLVIACERCNRSKADMTPEEWLA